MKTKFLTLAFSLMVLVSGDVFADGGESEGKVLLPSVNEYGIFFFSAGTHGKKPACHTMGGGWEDTWAVDLKTPYGKSAQAIVLTAHAEGKRVHVVGKGTCEAWGDRETVSWLYIVD